MGRVVAGDVAVVSPRWGGPAAGAVRLGTGSTSGRWHMGQMLKGEVVLITSVSSGGGMCDVRRGDGTAWSVERADLIPLSEAGHVSEG